MSEFNKSTSRDSRTNDLSSVSRKAENISKWNELFCILLNFPNYTTWNIVILLTVVLNYILATINLTHAPDDVSSFIFFYAAFDTLYLTNFILLLLHRVWNVAKTDFQYTVETTVLVLILDFLSILPQTAMFVAIFETRYGFLVPYFRIVTMLRLYNLFSMRRKIGIFQRNRFCWLLIQYFLILVIFVHTTNFVWFFIECRNENCPKQLYRGDFQKISFKDWTEWYFHHFFASIQILLNIRFGDILPKNFYELYLFIIIIILGHGLAVWFISNFTWYLMNRNNDRAFFSQKVADIKRYVEETDDDTKTKTVKYYSTMWKHRGKINHPSFLATLPPSLKTDLIHDINCGLLYRSVLLRDLPELVLRKISSYMKSIYLLADEVIYSQCVVKTCMVCIENGALEVLNDEDEESRVIVFTPGTIIGESALFVNVPSKATVRAVENTELRILEKKDFLNLMTHFPNIMRNLKYEIEKRMTDSFTDKTPRNFSLPNLKRLKVKLQRDADDEQKTSRGGEYPNLYKIEKSKSFGNKQNGLSLMKSWRFLYSTSQAIFCLMYSFEVIFKRTNVNRFEVFGILMDILCFVDIVLQTTTSRVSHKNIMTSLRKTIDQRLNDWEYNLDIYSLFPMELWSHFIEQPLVRNRLYDLFKLNRLLRLHRINEIVQYFESDVRGRYCIGWIFKILLYGFLFYYSSACIIHLISCPYEICEDGSWYQPSRRNDSTYSTVNSIYFAMMLSFSTGLDGFLSNSYNGIAILITILTTLVFLKNYALGMIISAVFLEKLYGKQQQLRFFLKRFFVFYRMSPLSYQRLSKIFRIDPYFSEGSTRIFIEETAPHYTLMLLQTSKIKNTLAEIPLFLMVDTYFLTFIEKHAKILKVPNNEILYSFGDLTRQMFVIQKGFCHVYNSEDSLERTVGHGTQLGVLEMLFCIPKRHTVVTCTDCVIVCLEYTTFRQILELFPKEKITMEDLVLDEGFLTRLKKTKTDEEFDDDYEIRSHILSDQKCFISLTKTWPNYCELYREKLGIFWFCAVLLMPVSVHPEGFFLVLWCATRSISIVILGILEPIMILAPAFADGLYWWKVICHSSLYFDIYILMHVAYYDGRGFLKIHPAHTFWYYFCHGFFLDLLAAVPWELLMIHLSPDNHGMADKPPHFHHCSWGLLKLTQFYKVFKCLTFLDENIFGSVKSMKIAKILLAIVLVINISTSLGINYICQTQYRIPTELQFFDESNINDVNYLQCQGSFWQENSSVGILHQEPLQKYMVGLYTVVNLMTQTGIDDTTIRTFDPRIGAVILTFIGFMLFTILIAILSILILEGFVETSENPEDVFRLIAIFESEGLKNNIRRKCFRHFEFIWRHNGAASYQVIKKLHPELDLNNTLFSFYKSILQDVPLFINYDTNFLGVIVDHILVKQFVKGEIIVKCKDILSDMYIIAKGEVDILNTNDECMQTIGPAGVFGNISDNYNILSEIQVVARKNVELWTLKTEKLLILINIYSVVVDELEHILKNKPNFILPIIMNGADIPNELESDFDPVVRKSSILLMKYKSFQFCLPQKWFKFSLEYDHGIFKFVDTTTAIASILNLLTIPYVFVTQERGLFGYLYLIFEPIFYLRIFFKLHRSYVNVYGNLIQSNKKLCKKYINSPMQLFWDVVPNFPIGSMCFIFPREEWFFSYSCLRLLHILRFYYVSQYFECNSELHRKMWLLLVKLLLYNVLIIHILACIWFMLACPFDNCNTDSWISGFEEHVLDRPAFYRMVVSYYYVLTVLTTTGIGDIRSTNILELLFTSINMFMGKIMLAILIGSVLRTLHQSEIRLTRYQNQARNCLEYLKEQNVPAYQMRRTRTYMENIWRYNEGNEPIKLLDLLPNPLKQDSLTLIYGSQLRDTFLFKDIDEALLREICAKLEKKVYFRNDYIVKHGDVDCTMYFIYRGNVSVLTKYSYFSEIFHVMLHPKDLFGVSQGLNLEKYHTFYYRASSKEVEILTLKFDDWSYLLSLFPKDHQRIFSKVEKEYLQ